MGTEVGEKLGVMDGLKVGELDGEKLTKAGLFVGARLGTNVGRQE